MYKVSQVITFSHWINNINKSGEFKMTHQAIANRFSLFSRMASGRGRTDTIYENSDHLSGRGRVGQHLLLGLSLYMDVNGYCEYHIHKNMFGMCTSPLIYMVDKTSETYLLGGYIMKAPEEKETCFI